MPHAPSHPRPRSKATLAALLAASLLAPPILARPNFGLYVDNYVEMVPSDAGILIHPTGEYVAYDDRKAWKKAAYEPALRETDDMDRAILEMRDKGYVMIGYSAFGTNEADRSLEDKLRTMGAVKKVGYKLGLRLRGIKADDDPLGDPLDAARWANAEHVIVQRDYAFTRMETHKDRIVTDEGRESTRSSSRSRSGHTETSSGSTRRQKVTLGARSSKSRSKNESFEAGVTGRVPSAQYGQTRSSQGSLVRYGEMSRSAESHSARSASRAFSDDASTTTRKTKHWATALIDRHVDHYAYMVTFWKRVDPSRVTLGVVTEPVSRDLWAELGTRHARTVSAVIGESPAYLADLWEGDVLLAIDGEHIAGAAGFEQLLDAHSGSEVTVTLWRGGETLELPVTLNAADSRY